MKAGTFSRGLVIAISLGTVLGGTAYKLGAHGTAMATQASGVSVTPLAPLAQFDEIQSKALSDDWQAQIKTKGLSDFHVVQVTIQPGGTLGWHTHLGPSFVVLKSGAATFYQ